MSGVISCSSENKPAPGSAEIDEIRAYADIATKAALEGISENNRDKYIQYGNAQFKAAVTQEVFDKSAGTINSQLGSLNSITFLSTEEKDGYTIVHYRAKFSKGEVGVRMVFDKEHLIAGQWFE